MNDKKIFVRIHKKLLQKIKVVTYFSHKMTSLPLILFYLFCLLCFNPGYLLYFMIYDNCNVFVIVNNYRPVASDWN